MLDSFLDDGLVERELIFDSVPNIEKLSNISTNNPNRRTIKPISVEILAFLLKVLSFDQPP